MTPSHHTKNGFRNNYSESVVKSFSEILRWRWQSRRAGLPKPARSKTPTTTPESAFLRANGDAGSAMQPTATWIGHSTVLVQASGLSVLTDPVFSERTSPVAFAGPKRAQPPGILLEDLPRLDVVLISHNHYDHLDRPSVEALARRHAGVLFLVPLGLAAWFKRRGIDQVVELDWWQSHCFKGVEFILTPTQHWSSRSPFDRNRTLWGAWAALGADFHWYFGGDSGYSRDFLDTRQFFLERHQVDTGGGFDLALIAIGAYEPRWFMREQHVEPSESLQIHQDLGAKQSLAIHWGTFSLTDESIDEPPLELRRAMERIGFDPEMFRVAALGQTFRYAVRSLGSGHRKPVSG